MSLLDELTIQRTEKSDIRILNILRKIVRMKDQVKLSYHFSYRLIITYFIFRYIAFLASQSNFNSFILFHFIRKALINFYRLNFITIRTDTTKQSQKQAMKTFDSLQFKSIANNDQILLPLITSLPFIDYTGYWLYDLL